jgi:hypothetical protein
MPQVLVHRPVRETPPPLEATRRHGSASGPSVGSRVRGSGAAELPLGWPTADPQAPEVPDGEHDAVARAIGLDHARHGITPPPEHLLAGHPVRHGWELGVPRFRGRARAATPSVRQWLGLRLEAWRRGIAFDELHVTPHYLRQLATLRCPVLRCPIDPAAAEEHRAVVMRLREDRGFELGNLAVLSARAARARDGLDAGSALQVAMDLDGDPGARHHDLDAAQWARLAVLLSFAEPPPEPRLRELPLLVMPPARVHVVHPLQGLQVLLTLLVTQPAFARCMANLAGRIADPGARRAFHAFVHTLLARRLEVGRRVDGVVVASGLEDAWRHPMVVRRWRALAALLEPPQVLRLLDGPRVRRAMTGPRPGPATRLAA